MEYKSLLTGLIMGLVGHAMSWFCFNSQMVWSFWKEKPLLSVIVFGIPSNIIFWFATKILRDGSVNLWHIRWTLFAMSFPPAFFLTKVLLNEEFLTTKNIITLFLASCIVFVQLFIGNK